MENRAVDHTTLGLGLHFLPGKRLSNRVEIERDGVLWSVCYSDSGKKLIGVHRADARGVAQYFFNDPSEWRKPPLAALIAEARRRRAQWARPNDGDDADDDA